MEKKIKENKCSFCGISEVETSILVGDDDNTVFICLNCVNDITNMSAQLNINEELEEEIDDIISQSSEDKSFNLSPRDIKKELDYHIIGQEKAKKTISIAAYNHYKRLAYNNNDEIENKIELDKSNILFIGPSGTGKTLIVETLAKLLDVPFIVADATTLTEAGYVGEDVESMLSKLVQKVNGNVKEAEKGIVFIDELDKISSKNIDDRSNTRDVAGEGVQQALLKIIEGKEVPITLKKELNTEKEVIINTKNILFIAAGAFVGLENIIEQRFKNKTVGFNKNINIIKNNSNTLSYVNSNDLIQYGIIPELLGRFPIITYLEKLTDEQMLEILTQPKNSIIKQFTTLLNLDNVNIEFDEDALLEIVECSKNRNLGARGLRSILDEILHDIMFIIEDYKDDTIKITKKMVIEKTKTIS